MCCPVLSCHCCHCYCLVGGSCFPRGEFVLETMTIVVVLDLPIVEGRCVDVVDVTYFARRVC